MIYNKRQYRKENNKNILHKVGKQWKVVSLAMLVMIGGVALASHTSTRAMANTVNNNGNSEQALKGRINSNLQKNSAQNQKSVLHEVQQNDSSNRSLNTTQAINQQANQLHQRILTNATRQMTSSNSNKTPNNNLSQTPNSRIVSQNNQNNYSNSNISNRNQTSKTVNYNPKMVGKSFKDNKWAVEGFIPDNSKQNNISLSMNEHDNNGNGFFKGLNYRYHKSDEDFELHKGLLDLRNQDDINKFNSLIPRDATMIDIDSDVKISNQTKSLSGLFSNLPHLQTVLISNSHHYQQITNLSNMFANDPQLTEIDTNELQQNDLDRMDFSDVSDISGMFKGDTSLNGVDFLPKRLNFKNLTNDTDAFKGVPDRCSINYYQEKGNQTSDTLQSLNRVGNLKGTKWLGRQGKINHLQLHDIYNDDTPSINPLISKDVASNHNTITLSNSDLPTGWSLVDDNGNPVSNITKNMQSGGSNLDVNVAPYYDGLTFTDKKVSQAGKPTQYQLEFKKGKLTGWNGDPEPNNPFVLYNPTTFLGSYRHRVSEINGSDFKDLYYSDAPVNVNASYIKDVKFDSDVDITPVSDMNYMFSNLHDVSDIDFGKNFKTSQVNTMNNVFAHDRSLNKLDNLSTFNPVNSNSFYEMFYDTGLHSLTLPSNFDISKAKDTSDMFSSNQFLTTIDFSKDAKFNTNNVNDMNNMFGTDPVLNHLALPDTFNTSNVRTMNYMFYDDYSLSDLNIVKPNFKGSFFNTSNVSDMSYMFASTNLSNIVLPKTFNTSKVSDMSYMFAQKKDADGTNSKILKSITFPSDFTTKNLASMLYDRDVIGNKIKEVPTTADGATAMFSVTSDLGNHNHRVAIPNSDLHIHNHSNNLVFQHASDVGLPENWMREDSIDSNPTWKNKHYNKDVNKVNQLPKGDFEPVAVIHFQGDLLLSDNSDVNVMYLPAFQSRASWTINAPRGTNFNNKHSDDYTIKNSTTVQLPTGVQNDCSYLFELPVTVSSGPIIVDYISNNENFIPQFVYNPNFNPNEPISQNNEQFKPNVKYFKVPNPNFKSNEPQSRDNPRYIPDPNLFPKYTKDGKLNPDYENFFSNNNSLIYKKVIQGKYNTPVNIFSPKNIQGVSDVDFYHNDPHKDFKVDSDYNNNLYQYYVFFKSKPQIITVPLEGKYATTGDNQVIINLYTQDNAEGKNRQLNRVIETSLPGYIGTYRSLDPNDYLVQLHKYPSRVINSNGPTMSDPINEYDIDNSSKPKYFFMHGDNNGGVDLYRNPTTKFSDDPPVVDFFYDRSADYSSDVKGINVRYITKNNHFISGGYIKPAPSDYGKAINVTDDSSQLTDANSDNTGISVPSGYYLDPNQDLDYTFTNNQQTANIYVDGNPSKQPITIRINQYMKNRFNQTDTSFNQDGFINGVKTYDINKTIFGQVGNSQQLSQNKFYPAIKQGYYDVPDNNTQNYLIRYVDDHNIIYNQNDEVLGGNIINFNYNIYKKSNSFRRNVVHYVSYSDVNHGDVTNYISTLSDKGNTKDDFDYGNDDHYYRENVPKGYQFYRVLSLNNDKNPNSDYVKNGLQDFRESDQNETIEVIPNARPITFHYVTPSDQIKKSVTVSGQYNNPEVAIAGEQGYTSKYGTKIDNSIIDRQAMNNIQYRHSLGVPFGYHISKETQSPTFTTQPQIVNVMIAGNKNSDTAYITIKEENKNNSDIENTFTIPDQIKGSVGDDIDLIAGNYTPRGYKVDSDSGKIKDGSSSDMRNGDQTVHVHISPLGQLSQKNVTFYYKDVSAIPSSITLEYINQNGKKVGYSDTLYGNSGQNFNLTDPSDGGEAIPKGYTLNGAYSTTKGHNSDSDLVGQYQNTILPIQNQPRTVVLDVTGKAQNAKVQVNRIVENSDGCHKVLSPDNITVSALNGNSDILKPSDYNPNSSKYMPDYSKDSNQNIQVNNGTATPNSVTFYYDSKTLKGAPAVVRYINQDTGQEVSDPYVFNGNVNQSFDITNQDPVPMGYNLVNYQNTSLTLTNSPQTIDLYVQGKMIHSDTFNIHVIKEDASDHLVGQISPVPIKISGRIGDTVTINPYHFNTGNDIESINGNKSGQYTTPNGFHATGDDADVKLNINQAGNLAPVQDVPYIYQQNAASQAIGNVKVHYITSDTNAVSDHQSLPNKFNGYRELDAESDTGFIGKSKFDLTPYTHDIPEVLRVGYNVSQVVDSNNNDIDTNHYQWTINQPQKNIYVKVQNNNNSPIILF